ncbi:MAG: hypothetical protein FJ030_07720 [Chloroflexi bacterium]|nr:hypothetical protein [Chloroflexota bacterium]
MITFGWFGPLMWAAVVVAVIAFASIVGPILFGAPWVPMPFHTARRMLQLADVRPGETVCDLGSGDGRVLIVAAREFGANGVGVEIEPLRAFISRLTLFVLGLRRRTRVIRANFLEVDLGDADVITLYLLPKAIRRLAPKLRAELKPGARVVTLTYHLPDWPPAVERDNIRVYRI